MTPLEVSGDDFESLRDVLGDFTSYSAIPPRTAKACGGFHPDAYRENRPDGWVR